MATIQERRKQIERMTAGAYPKPKPEQWPPFTPRTPEEQQAMWEWVFGSKTCIHFVGFKGAEYVSAVRVFGRPDFIHRKNDVRLHRGGELAPHDVIVYANGCENAVKLDAVDDSNIDVQAFEKQQAKERLEVV